MFVYSDFWYVIDCTRRTLVVLKREAEPGMNTFKLTALAGLFAITGHAFAVDDITRVDQIPVLKEETQHATVS